MNIDKEKLLKLKRILICGVKCKSPYLIGLALTVLLNSGFTTEKSNKANVSGRPFESFCTVVPYETDARKLLSFVAAKMSEEINKPFDVRQQELLDKYGIELYDLLYAITDINPLIRIFDFTKAEEIRARADFEEIEKEFKDLARDRVEYILKRYSITEEQLNLMIRRMLNESGGYNYNEVLNVWSSLLNRIYSSEWTTYLNNNGVDGYNIYAQFSYKKQYGTPDTIKRIFDNPEDWLGYYASLDILCSGIPTHNYTEYRYNLSKKGYQYEDGKIINEQVVNGLSGNKYRHPVDEYIDNPELNDVPKKLSVYEVISSYNWGRVLK